MTKTSNEPVGYTACWMFGFNKEKNQFGRCRLPKGHPPDMECVFYTTGVENE